MGRGLQRADDGPLHRGVDLPPPDPDRIDDRTARRGVALEEIVERAEAAHRPRSAEAPGRGAEPADVLGRLAGVGQLPIQHRPQPVGTDQEVAGAEVAVHRHPPAGRQPVGLEPAHAELERRPGLAQRVEEGERVPKRVPGRQSLDRRRIDGVDGRQGPGALLRQRLARPGPFGVTQDLARDGLPLQALDHQPARAQPVVDAVAHGHHRGHGDTGVVGRPQQGRLGVGPAALGQPVTPVQLEDEAPDRAAPSPSPPSSPQIEGTGEARGPTGQRAQVLHRAAEPATERRRDVVGCTARPHPLNRRLNRPGRQASRCRRAGAGTRRCRSRCGRPRWRPTASSGPAPR